VDDAGGVAGGVLGAGGGDFVAVAAVEMLDDGNGLVVAGLVVEGDLEGFLGGP
jgi:hypothetical protein